MKEQLRAEYENYLSRYGLKPRPQLPKEVREASMREVVRIMYEEARSRDDPMAEHMMTLSEERIERDLAETRHPAVISIEKAALSVEETIRTLPAFAERFHDNVFVGEFPTGSMNCETVRVEGGFLVLVNSGTLTMLQQVVTFLCRGDADNPTSSASLEAADGIADVLANYVEHGDPFYGPKPLLGGMLSMLSSPLSCAAEKFVVAHEYGHILAGHLAESSTQSIAIESGVGTIEVVRKNHEQEFEADDLGYRLTLGIDAYDKFDLKPIDAAGISDDASTILGGVEQKSLIAAPFVPLTIEVILNQFNDAAHVLGNNLASRDTHPRAIERIKRLMDFRPGKNPFYTGFINIPFMLLPSVERIVTVVTDRTLRKPDAGSSADGLFEREKAHRRRIES